MSGTEDEIWRYKIPFLASPDGQFGIGEFGWDHGDISGMPNHKDYQGHFIMHPQWGDIEAWPNIEPGDTQKDEIRSAVQQKTQQLPSSYYGGWKEAIKPPPSAPLPTDQLEFEPTAHKYVMLYLHTYDDIDEHGNYINEHMKEDRISCDPDHVSESPVQAAVDIIWGEGLSERDGGECFYDPDGGDQNYKTGTLFEVSACLGGFTPEEVEQIHSLLDEKWPPRSASWKEAETQWPPEWLAKARKIRDKMFNEGLWGEDMMSFDYELSSQIEEQLGLDYYDSTNLANEVVYELQHKILQKPIGVDELDPIEHDLNWDGPHTFPATEWKNVGPYYGATSPTLREMFPIGSLVEIGEGSWKGQVGQVSDVNEITGFVNVQINSEQANEFLGRPYGNFRFFWGDLVPGSQMLLQDPPKPRRWKSSHVFDPKQITLDPLVFDHEDKLLPRLQKFIQQEVEELFGKHTGMGHQYFNAYLSGPVATYRYNPLGDADLYIVPTYQQLPAHTDPEELRKHLQQKAAEHIDGTHLPGTRHRLHAIVVKPGSGDFQLFNDQDRPAWDFSKQDWLVRPQRHHADESNALNHHLQRAHEIKDKMEILDPSSRREYKLYLKQRSEEEPNEYSTPTMIFRFLTDQKLAASPEVQQQAQQTMDAIKNSPSFKHIYKTFPDTQPTVEAFTNHLVNRYPQLHPLYMMGIHDVAAGLNPMNTTMRMKRLHSQVENWRDQGQLPPDFDYDNHAHLDSLQFWNYEHGQKVEQMNRQQGETVYHFSDDWHVDLAHPTEGQNISYYILDPDNDIRATITFARDTAHDPEIHGPEIWRPHTLHPGDEPDGAWFVSDIVQENKQKANLGHPWEDDQDTQEHIREWVQHMKQWGQKFNAENVNEEVPHISNGIELLDWYEENFDDKGNYRDPSDPHGFHDDQPNAPTTSDSWEDLLKDCISSVLSAHEYGGWNRNSVNDEKGLADAFYALWKLDSDGTSLAYLVEKADEITYESFDEWLDQNYSMFQKEIHDKLEGDFRDWLPKDLTYQLEEAEEKEQEDGGDYFGETFLKIWDEVQPGEEHEDVYYNIEETVRDEWWRNGPYEAAASFCQRLNDHSNAAPKQSMWRESDEKFKVIYDFDGDRITLGTLADVQGNAKILGEYDGKSVTLDQPSDAWLNKEYFTRLWEFSFPDRKLENVHIDASVPRR